MKVIDLRSDTVTRPTPEMRQIMAGAEVGDDVMGEDPTVNRLEQRVADLFGREAAIFVCSGTQCNQIAVRIHCLPGDELLIHETGHIALFEGGAPAALSGVTVRTLSGEGGFLNPDQLESALRADDVHFPRTRLVCAENTTNIGGGRVYSIARLQKLSQWASLHGLKSHLDGARLFNAMIAGRYSAPEVGECFDTISICFSKGLGCPMGSMLIGSRADIQQARRIRKLFGGALRQAGIVAAAADFALDHHVNRLQQDHENARILATGLSEIGGLQCDIPAVESNLVFFQIDPRLGRAGQLTSMLQSRGILLGPMGSQRVRAVTHLDVSTDDIQKALQEIRYCVAHGFSDIVPTANGPYASR